MDLCDSRHERKMIVGATPLVAAILPSARIAVFLRIRIYLAPLMLTYCGFETVANAPVIGKVVVHPVDLRNEIRPGCDDVAECRAGPLNRSNQIRIQTELQTGPALGLAGEFGIDQLV